MSTPIIHPKHIEKTRDQKIKNEDPEKWGTAAGTVIGGALGLYLTGGTDGGMTAAQGASLGAGLGGTVGRYGAMPFNSEETIKGQVIPSEAPSIPSPMQDRLHATRNTNSPDYYSEALTSLSKLGPKYYKQYSPALTEAYIKSHYKKGGMA